MVIAVSFPLPISSTSEPLHLVLLTFTLVMSSSCLSQVRFRKYPPPLLFVQLVQFVNSEDTDKFLKNMNQKNFVKQYLSYSLQCNSSLRNFKKW